MYRRIRSATALRTFTEHHVICVLDFMSLLKSLQRELCCMRLPWTPPSDPESARLIAEIAVDEESDLRSDGRVQSHFEWYVEAMEEIGASTAPIRDLVAALEAGTPWQLAIAESRLPAAARAFGQHTGDVLDRALHVRAAVFFHGREEILPELFLPTLDGIRDLDCTALREYLQRHIEVDGGEHGPRASAMLERIYGGDPHTRRTAEDAALESLRVRERLWDAISDAVERGRI